MFRKLVEYNSQIEQEKDYLELKVKLLSWLNSQYKSSDSLRRVSLNKLLDELKKNDIIKF